MQVWVRRERSKAGRPGYGTPSSDHAEVATSVSWARVFTGCFAVITPSAFTAIAKGFSGMPRTRAHSASGTAMTGTPAGSRTTLSLPGAGTLFRRGQRLLFEVKYGAERDVDLHEFIRV